MATEETWLADAVADWLRTVTKAGVKDLHVYKGANPTKSFDQLEAMVEDMFTYENARITEAIERDYAGDRDHFEEYGM
jgi:hypothetical protein